jgi:hypothetical protein
MTSIVTALCFLCELCAVGEEMVFYNWYTLCSPCVMGSNWWENWVPSIYCSVVRSNSIAAVSGIDLLVFEGGKKHTMKISVSGVQILWQAMATISYLMGCDCSDFIFLNLWTFCKDEHSVMYHLWIIFSHSCSSLCELLFFTPLKCITSSVDTSYSLKPKINLNCS